MQVKGAGFTVSNKKKKEEAQKKRQTQTVKTGDHRAQGATPVRSSGAVKTVQKVPGTETKESKAAKARATAQRSTQTKQQTAQKATAFPVQSGRVDPISRMQTGAYKKENPIKQQPRAPKSKEQAAKDTAKGLVSLAKNDAKKAGNTIKAAAQKAETQKQRSLNTQVPLTKEKRERKRQIENEMAQIRQVRDDKKAEEMTSKLPKEIKGLLDEYNKTVDAQQHTQFLGGGIGDLASYAKNAKYLQTVKERQHTISKQLQDAGYKNYEELASWRKRVTDKEATQQMEQDLTQFGQKHPVLGSTAARVLSPVAAVVTAVENASDLVRGDKTDAKTMNTYSAGWAPTRMKNALDQGVSDSFEDGKLSKKTKTFLYQTFASGVDSVVASAVPGGEAVLGLSAANDTVLDVANRGGTRGQAILSGLAAGVAESLFEHVSIGELRMMRETPVKSVKDAILNIGRSTATNFSEEAATEIANVFTDRLINGGNSDYYNTVMEGMAHGLTEKEAKAEANKQLGIQVGLAGAGGALMGGVFGAGGSVMGAATQRSAVQQQGAQIAAQDGGRARVLAGAQDALESGVLDKKQTKKVRKLLSQAEAAAVASDGRASSTRGDRALGALAEQVTEATDKETAQIVAAAARQRLETLGETGDTEQVSRAIAAIATGTAENEQTAKQAQQTIAKSRYGTRVLNEVNDRSGRFSSDWTQEMDTEITELQQRRYEGAVSRARRSADSNAADAAEGGRNTAQPAQLETQRSGMSEEGRVQAEQYFERTQIRGEDVDPAAFAKDFEDVYNFGKSGNFTLEQVIEDTPNRLTEMEPDAVRAAFRAGERAADSTSSVSPFGRSTFPTSVEGKKAAEAERENVQIPAVASDGRVSSAEQPNARRSAAQPQIVTNIQQITADGEAIVRLQDGSSVNAADVEMDHQTRKVIAFATAYDSKTAEAFFQGAAQASSISSYRDAFRAYYGAGALSGMDYETYRNGTAGKVYARYLTPEAARAAFAAGQRLATETKKAPSVASGNSSTKRGAKGEKREGRYTNSAAIDESVDTMLQLLAKKTGIDIERLQRVSAGKIEANGRFMQGLCKIEISDNALNFFGDLMHELTHAGRAFNLDGYHGYAGAVMQWYQQTYGDGSAMDRLQEIYDVYHANDADFTMADALEEFTSEATAGLFSTEDGAQDFTRWLQNESGYTAAQKKTVLQKAAELFEKIINRIKALLQDGVLSSTAMDFAEAQADEAAKLRQVFLQALDGMEVAEGATEQRGEKFSIKYPRFSESEIEDNKNTLARMDAVYHVPKEKLQKTGRRPSEIFSEAFAKWGNNIYSEQFGDVALSKASVKSDIAHGRNAEKIASTEAIKAVIESGKVIFFNRKSGSNADRIVVAAPITIGDNSYYMGVMLQRDVNTQRLYLHNVAIEKETSGNLRAILNSTGAVDSAERFSMTTILQNAINVKRNLLSASNAQVSEKDAGTSSTSDGKNSLRMADQTSPVTPYGRDTLSTFGEGKETAGDLERVEYTDGPNGEVLKNGRVQVARIVTFGAQNNREIVRRLQAQSDFFKGLTTADALAQFRYAEKNGLVERGDDWLAVYHDANDAETIGEAERMDKLRLSLGIEAQNRNLLQQNEEYRKIVRQQDVEIRELQRTLAQAGVKIFANSGKVSKLAGKLLQNYGSQRIQGLERRKITDALEGLYNSMANEGGTRDTAQTQAGEIAEMILSQSKYLTPEISEYSRTVIDDVKSIGIRLSDAQKAEAAYRYGSYGAFYRQSLGKIKIRNDGVSLDQRWQELSEAYPNIFDAAASDADQPALLLEAIQALQNDYIDENGFDFDEAKQMLTGEILNGFRDMVTGSQAVATKQRQMAQQERDEYEKQIARLKERNRTQAEVAKKKAKELVREAKTETAKKLRAEYDEKFLQNRARYEQRAQNIADTQLKQAQRKRIEQRITRFARMLAPTRGSDNIVKQLRPVTRAMLDVFPESRMDGFQEKKWADLGKAYRNMQAENEDFAGIYKEVAGQIEQAIDVLGEQTDGKRFSQLSLRQLQNISKIMDHINTMIKNENEVLIEGRKQKTAQIGAQVMRETKQNAQRFRLKFAEKMQAFDVNNLKPGYFFARLGDTMNKLYKSMEGGQDDWARSVQSGKQFFEQTAEKYHLNSWKNRKETLTLQEGDEGKPEQIELTIGQMLSLYATARREGLQTRPEGGKQTMHLLGGGIVLPNQFRKSKDGRWQRVEKTHHLTIEDIQHVADLLTDEQKAYADQMVGYLSTEMAAKGNKVTMELYGFDMFTEGYYFPLNTEGAYRFQKFGEQGETMLQALGFTNATKRNAATPIVLGEFDEIWANHVERMSAYSSLVIPIASMQRVWNYKEELGGIGKTNTLAAEFNNSYGKAYVDYFKQFMKDINGDMMGDKRAAALTKWLSKFKKNAVFASASVTVQQPSAVCRAFVYIDPKYFAATTACNRKRMYEEAKQYAGVAIIKEMGGFDVGSGKTAVSWMLSEKTRPQGIREKAQAFVDPRDSSYRDEKFGWAAGKADEITWAHIWAAAKKKAQVEERLSGEALNQRAAEIFTEAITMTQVYDSVFSRSANMRSSDGLMKAATAFMGEPTTTINMLEHALFHQKDGKYAAKVVSSVVLATAFNAMLKSIITAGRDDDEDKNPFEKYIAQVFSNFLDDLNPATMIPIFRDIWSMLQGFSVERSELSVFQDLIDAVEKAMNGKGKWTWDSVAALAGAIGPFVDLPARNMLRDFVNVPLNTWRGFKAGNQFSAKGVAYAISQQTGTILKRFNIVSEDAIKEMLYDAFVDGDNDTYRRMAQKYKGDGGIKKALVDQIEEAYIGGRITGKEAQAQLERLPDYDRAKADDKVRTWTFEIQNLMFEESGDEEATAENRQYDTLENLSAATKEARDSGEESKGSWDFFDDAIASGDASKMKVEAQRLQGLGRSKEEIDRHLKDYVRKNDPDLQRAGALYKNGDVSVLGAEAVSIARRYGMDQGQVMQAIRTAAGVSNSPIDGTNYQLNDLKRAIESGSKDTYNIKWEIVKAKEQQFKDKDNPTNAAFESLRSSLTSYFKPKYIAADAAGRERIRQQLVAASVWPNEAMVNSALRKWAQGS